MACGVKQRLLIGVALKHCVSVGGVSLDETNAKSDMTGCITSAGVSAAPAAEPGSMTAVLRTPTANLPRTENHDRRGTAPSPSERSAGTSQLASRLRRRAGAEMRSPLLSDVPGRSQAGLESRPLAAAERPGGRAGGAERTIARHVDRPCADCRVGGRGRGAPPLGRAPDAGGAQDRKSTRLNSSHPSISYPVFCLKKN